MDTFVSSRSILNGGDGGGRPTVEGETMSVLVVGRM